MTLAERPRLAPPERLKGAAGLPPPDVMARWDGALRAESDEATIPILDVIGADVLGEGVAARGIAGALRAIGPREVRVQINSPGGDFFEGVAIYNLLREHRARVSVEVLGLAASAASVIAMAGDEVRMGQAAFLMVHNAWVMAIGDCNAFGKLADDLARFDDVMAEVYAARSGAQVSDVEQWMKAETWFSADAAIEAGLADGRLSDAAVARGEGPGASVKPVRVIEAALAERGMTRSQRLEVMNAFRGMPGAAAREGGTPGAAAAVATPGAGDIVPDLRALIDGM